jgi:hypothetical protein
MNKKVTRRVALGTVAVGLGGLVAAPYIISSLKSRYKNNLSQSRKDKKEKIKVVFNQDWGYLTKALNVPITEIDGPKKFTLNYNLENNLKFNVLSLQATYNKLSHPAVYPQPPYLYTIVFGEMYSISPIVNNKPALFVKANNYFSKSVDAAFVNKVGECIIVPGNDNLLFFEMANGVPKEIPMAKVNVSCLPLAEVLDDAYPTGKELTKGMKWVIPETSTYYVELPFSIVGFAEVAGRQTVKMSAERHLNNQKVQEYMTKEIQAGGKFEKERGNTVDVDKEVQRSIQRVIKGGTTMDFAITKYVDLTTGIVIRYENKVISTAPKIPENGHTAMIIHQLFES